MMLRVPSRKRISTGLIVAYGFLSLLGIINIFPFYWAILAAFKYPQDIIRVPAIWFTLHLTLTNFSRIFVNRFDMYYRNSIIQVGLLIPLLLFSSSLGGFIFSKFNFRGKELIFKMLLSTMMLPFIIMLIPMVVITGRLHLINSLLGLVVPFMVSPFGIYFMRQFMEGIPNEMLDAARIDGASNWMIYVQIMIPLSKAALSTLAIFFFLDAWNSFLWPLVTMYNENVWTLPLGAAQYANKYSTEAGPSIAAAVTMMLPLIIAFIFFQKGIVEGIALTGMK